MVISLKVKTLDSQTYEFTVDDEISVRQFKDTIAEKTNISADLQRIIYCGRVLADEKQLKEYDVNGKVVHVVERAPPNLRSGNNSGSSRNRRENDGPDPSVRASPLFRALDGMVIGAMTVPVNANIPQPVVNPSSSFCMNRITVARHMLECANNIAAYLENPERGLNNLPLDILTRGRFTMESTVVEVGISADTRVDIPQNQTQNFVEALNSAMSAALMQNGQPNFTVVQLPTMIRVNGQNQSSNATSASQPDSRSNEEEANGATAPAETSAASNNVTGSSNTTSSSGTPTEPTSQQGTAQQGNSPSTSNGQTTCTRVLAEVIDQMRRVQTRLDPFYQQYYDILLNDPQFNEDQTTERENAQRVFDRVSEAYHYMSHAQHAISDLMLDLSQSTPRHLCCRPILVEQSGYVSSNNYLASFFEPNGNNNETTMTNNNASNAGNLPPQFSMTTHTAPLVTATTTAAAEAPSQQTASTQPQAAPPTNGAASQSQTQTQEQQPQPQPPPPLNNIDWRRILAQVLQPMQMRPAVPRTTAPTAAAPTTTPASTENPAPNPANPQIQVARLIQAVVNSAPIHADVHVQINAPNLIGYGMPSQTSQTPSQANSQTNGTTANTAASERNPSESQPRFTTATHPTTSTQTRSTARPQVHISNLPPSQMWNARVIPANMVSSFDRFLPCSSHHIRETEQTENPPHMPTTIYTGNRIGHMRAHRRHPAGENPTIMTTRSTTTAAPPSTTTGSAEAAMLNLSNEDFNIPIQLFGSNLTLRDLINIIPNPLILNRIRNDLHAFIVNNLFSGAPITNENMNEAIDQVINMLNSVLVFLPQFDLPDYDARASVENFLRNTLPFIFNLVREDESNEFGTRLLRELMSFIRRMFVILVTCIGRSNAELYLHQVAQMTINSSNPIEQDALRALHRYLMSIIIRELDMTRQNTSDVQEFLVIRRPPPENNSNSPVTPMETDEMPTTQSEAPHSSQRIEPLQNNVSISRDATTTTTLPIPAPLPETNEPLPTVVPGSEPWHNNFPPHWLPIITRDMERQRKQGAQGSFSDAYISGMSAKRRKLVASTKPPADANALLTDGVRRALHTAGASSSNTPCIDEVTAAISSDPSAQLSYREALRSNIQERLKKDPDFTPEKFPNSSKYFNK